MLAPQNQTNSIVDVMDGTLSEWYNSVDQAIRASEVRPGEYEYTVEPSHTSQCPIPVDGSTMVDIKCQNLRNISLENSFIEVKQRLKLSNNKAQNGANVPPNGRRYYVGYQTAFGIVNQYRVYTNDELLQTVNWPHYEDLILNNVAIGDTAKQNSDSYANWEKVQRVDPNVPGCYIDLSAYATPNTTFPSGATESDYITLYFKIPLVSFLVLKNMKHQPGFWGKITLEIFPSHQNLVWCPIYHDGGPRSNTTINTLNGFTQIGLAANNFSVYTTATDTWGAVSAQTMSCVYSDLFECRVRLAQSILKMDIYNSLSAKYLQVPMLFPVQTVNAVKFSQSIGNNLSGQLTCSAVLHHCDAMFIVFDINTQDRNCFINPEFKTFQVNIDGKLFPRDTYSTVNDPRFTNMMMDAFNINNSTLLSIPTDLATSLQPYYRVGTVADAGTMTYTNTYITGDRSKFMIAIPFCNDEDFQGGLSPGGTSTIQVEYSRTTANINFLRPATAIFLEDKVMKCYSMKPGSSKQWDIVPYTIEEIMLRAMG